MDDLVRRALLGDQQAQEECTRQGIVLSCPLCGSIYTQIRHIGWENPPQAFQSGYRGECTECHAVTGAHNTEKEALTDWNRRPAPPIGRCDECKHYSENKKRCDHPKIDWDIECYDCWIEKEPDGFCNDFEPKGGEENG